MEELEVDVFILPDGTLRFIYYDELKPLLATGEGGNVEIKRASHIEPINLLLRIAFHSLRKIFGDKGWIANFTRKWPCLWRIDLRPSNGPILKPYSNRDEAITAEVEWLVNNHLENLNGQASN